MYFWSGGTFSVPPHLHTLGVLPFGLAQAPLWPQGTGAAVTGAKLSVQPVSPSVHESRQSWKIAKPCPVLAFPVRQHVAMMTFYLRWPHLLLWETKAAAVPKAFLSSWAPYSLFVSSAKVALCAALFVCCPGHNCWTSCCSF